MSRHQFRPRALLGAAVLFAGLLMAACGGGGGGEAPEATPSSTEPRSFVYATDYRRRQVLAFSIDAATGSLAPVAGSPFSGGVDAFQAVISPSGRFLYVAHCGVEPYGPAEGSNVSAYAINPDSGALTPLPGSPFAAGSCAAFLAFSASGAILHALNTTSNDITTFSVNKGTGDLTRVGEPVAVGEQPQAIAVDPSG
jgi:6-phosphogluconolactonase (cycloisomerase 2 family)